MRPNLEPDPDEAPVMIVHPDDVDLPAIKAKAAELGVSVSASPNVPRGSAFFSRMPKTE